jgi:hypothetical protein
MADELTEADIDSTLANTLVTGATYSRPGFSKTGASLTELENLRDRRRARRRERLGAISYTDVRV